MKILVQKFHVHKTQKNPTIKHEKSSWRREVAAVLAGAAPDVAARAAADRERPAAEFFGFYGGVGHGPGETTKTARRAAAHRH